MSKILKICQTSCSSEVMADSTLCLDAPWDGASAWEVLHPTHTHGRNHQQPQKRLGKVSNVDHAQHYSLLETAELHRTLPLIAVFFIPRKKQWSMVPGFMKLSCLMVHLLTEPLNIRNWETVLKMRNKPTLSCLWYTKEAVLPMNFLTMPAWRQELRLLPASAQGAWESAFQKSIFSLFPVVISHWNNGFWPGILAPANRQGDFQSDASFSNHLKPH